MEQYNEFYKDSGTIVTVRDHLLTWSQRTERGMARVQYTSEFSRKRVVNELQIELHKKNIPFHEISLPSDLAPSELTNHIIEKLSQIEGGVVSITGFATALPYREPDRVRALHSLNLKREHFSLFPLCQIWWIPEHIAELFIREIPDLNSWFILKLNLAEIIPYITPTGKYIFQNIEKISIQPEDARKRSALLVERFEQTLKHTNPPADLVEQLAIPAVKILRDADLQREAQILEDKLNKKLAFVDLKRTKQFSPCMSNFIRRTVKGLVEQTKASIPGTAFLLGFFEERIFNKIKELEGKNRDSEIRDLRNAPLDYIENELKIAGIEREDIRHNMASIIHVMAQVWEDVSVLKDKVDLHDEILKHLMDFRQYPEAAKILSLPLVNNIPYNRNIYFTGREKLLLDLKESLSDKSGPAVLTQVMSGLGGVGKTQTALEYSYRFGKEYIAIFWISGEHLLNDFTNLANVLNLKERQERDLKNIVIPAILGWLNENPGWLLIFDNAEEPSSLQEFLPKSGVGNILITSRNTHWGNLAKPLEVPVMEKDEAVSFLLERSGYKNISEKDKKQVEILSEELGYLPVALEQAAAYIESSGCGFEKYLQYFKAQAREMMKRAKPEEYPHTVATTWKVSFEAAKEENEDSVDLLKLCAFLAPDDIPLKIIREGREFLQGKWDIDLSLDDSILSLRHYSLISRVGDSVSIHRLVQAITREEMEEEEKKIWCAAALHIMNKAFPQETNDHRTWEECKILLPHGEAVLKYSEEKGLYEDKDCGNAAGRLLNQMAGYYLYRGLYPIAEPLLRCALEIGEKTLGKDHPIVATYINNLAELLRTQGRYSEAEPLYRRALEIGEKVLGKDHPDVAMTINNLANLLYQTGRYLEAEPFFLRALDIGEKTLGTNHPEYAIRLNNLANLLYQTGRYSEAEPLYRRALQIGKKTLGADHPEYATWLNNLSMLLIDQGQYSEAEPFCRRALEINEKTLGKDHPNVGINLTNLALLLKKTGKYPEAEPLYRRALEIGEKTLGTDHPEYSIRLSNLASLLYETGRYSEAEPLFRRALEIDENILGSNHPNVARNLHNLGILLYKTGRKKEGISLEKRAYEINMKTLGPDHPYTKASKEFLEDWDAL